VTRPSPPYLPRRRPSCGGRESFTVETKKMKDMIDEIKARLTAAGADILGFADISSLPPEPRKEMPFAISLGVALDPIVIRNIASGPTREYYEEYLRTNRLLDSLARLTENFLRGRGFWAHGYAATDTGIDPKTHSVDLPHKTVATLAGLGWIGKCALLITDEFGSAVRITKVLTDAPLPPARPVTESRCGNCGKCVDACPGNAPVGTVWSPEKTRAEIFDAGACRQAARENARRRTGILDTFCGICISVCPWTQGYIAKEAGQKQVKSGGKT